jgi:hypothetical protein
MSDFFSRPALFGDPARSEYAGVLRVIAPGVRVILCDDAPLYRLQFCYVSEIGVLWLGPQGLPTLSRFIKVRSALLPGLAEACHGLPERASDAVPRVGVGLIHLDRFRTVDELLQIERRQALVARLRSFLVKVRKGKSHG